MADNSKIRVRFAPSPTGYLHIGNARTALFNRLFAARYKGSFVLRIEDTDRERSTKAFEDSILEDLKWLGIDWEEGPDKGGAFGPYRQSERADIYSEYTDKLIDKGMAYPCYCTHDRLEELKKRQIKAGWPPKYDGRCRTLPMGERPKDVRPVIRFCAPEKTVAFEDMVHKRLSFDASIFGDFIIVGSDGIANYNFAVVIDDALMSITHVIRGEDHISNTPRQILLFDAFGLPVPRYAHIPLILGSDRAPLSKRHGAASIMELKESGFLPEAIVNHLCHLGLSPGREFLSMGEAVELFSIEMLSRSPSVFDIDRLKAFNRVYIEKADTARLMALAEPYLTEAVRELPLQEAVEAVKGEAVTLRDIKTILLPLLKGSPSDEDARKVLKEPHVGRLLKTVAEEVGRVSKIDADTYKEIMARLKQDTGESGKRLFMPIRAALTGSIKGLDLEKIFLLLGKEGVMERMRRHIV